MGSFIEENLMPGERIIATARVHWMVYSPVVLNMAIGFIIFYFGKYHFHMQYKVLPILASVPMLIALWKAIQAYCHREYTEIGVTNDRLIVKFGVFGRESIELPLSRIESVIVDQTFSERSIDAGSIRVHGTGVTLAPIRYIENPMAFRTHINEAIAHVKGSNVTS